MNFIDWVMLLMVIEIIGIGSSAEARNRAPFKDFIYWIDDNLAYQRVPNKNDVKIRVGMHGLTNILVVVVMDTTLQ